MTSEFIFLFLVLVGAMILVENRLNRILNLITIHGLLLAAAAFSKYQSLFGPENSHHIAILITLIILFKVILTPWILSYTARKVHAPEDTQARIGFLGVSILLLGGFLVALRVAEEFDASHTLFTRLDIAYSLMVIYIGILNFTIRTHWIPLVVGYTLFENGVLLLAILLRTNLPVGVELGTFTDAVLVLVAAATIQFWNATLELTDREY